MRDGSIWSSVRISAGIDLALAMAAEDFGDEVARETARQLVLHERRAGGQSRFSSLHGGESAGRPLRAAAELGA